MMASLSSPLKAATSRTAGAAAGSAGLAPAIAAAGAASAADIRGALIVAAGTGERNVVRRNQVGKLFDQPRKLLDLAGERCGRRQRFVEDCFDLALHRSEPAVEVRELAREIARAADELGHLIVHNGALTFVGGDGTVDREPRRQDTSATRAASVTENPKRR